jgi:hypothetical protein
MTKDELQRQLRIILDAHEMLMIEQNGRPDCKNCVLAETIKELLDGKTIERIEQ